MLTLGRAIDTGRREAGSLSLPANVPCPLRRGWEDGAGVWLDKSREPGVAIFEKSNVDVARYTL